ncbi:Hypothetical protein A7982_09358 [Minicystis rosea]|nr:Hypothetical protein A7982_09358 [Minicystis rosea]
MAKANRSSAAARGALCFVDAKGGAFAAMAAAITRAQGRDAIAATSSAAARIPAEVGTVLGEIALTTPDIVLASKAPAGTERIEVDGWGHALYEGEGELEHLALARIARDRIERHVERLLGAQK